MPKDENQKTPKPSSINKKAIVEEDELWDLEKEDWEDLENNETEPNSREEELTEESTEDEALDLPEEEDSSTPKDEAPPKKKTLVTLEELEEEDEEGDEEDYDESFFDDEEEEQDEAEEIADTAEEDLIEDLEDEENSTENETSSDRASHHRSFKKETKVRDSHTSIKHRILEGDIEDIEDFDDLDDLESTETTPSNASPTTKGTSSVTDKAPTDSDSDSLDAQISTEWDDEEPEELSRTETTTSLTPTKSKTTTADLLEQEEARHPIDNQEPKSRATLLEKVSIIACILCLLTIAFIAFTYFNKEATVSTNEQTSNTSLPATGKQITITHIDSYWVKPSSDSPYKIKAGTDLAPLCIVKGKLKGEGCLRLFFKDNEGNTIGDALSLPFVKGKFIASGKDYVKVSATDGLENEIDFSLLTGGQKDPWSVTIYEGPSVESSSTQFTEVAHLTVNSIIGE